MISTVGRSEAEQVLSSLILGFAADPFIRWFYPEPDAYLKYFPRVIDLFGGGAFEHEGAYRNETGTAGALWLPHGVHPDEDGLVALFEKTVAPEKHDALFSSFEQMDSFHPEEPCWHLAFIASDPALAGKGLGSALLEATLKRCDSEGLPAYLESTNPANLPLYGRFGFEEIGLIETDQAPSLFPMLRPPK